MSLLSRSRVYGCRHPHSTTSSDSKLMAAIRVQDFDMLRRRVNVSRSVRNLGGWFGAPLARTWERRSMPFPATLCDELAALMVGTGRDDLVFTDKRGGVRRNSNWRARVFRPAVTK